MSTVASRLISGSAASWAQIAVTMITQIALIPIYLIYWSVEVYGVWIAIQAIINVLSTVDVGHQTFLGYEFLKFGKENRRAVAKYLWSGFVIGVFISIGQIVLIVGVLAAGTLPLLLGESNTEQNRLLLHDAGIVLILQSVTWLICTSTIGLVSRALAAFGHYPRTAWWRFIYILVTALAPLVAVLLGADLLVTGFAYAGALILYSIPVYIDLFRILHREKVYYTSPSLVLGYSNFVKSLGISAKSLFENMRHQGVRLFIAPLAGAAGLAAFSTMRTGANVALQGLNTIINPIMPDLMRFLHQRDQDKSDTAFATIWIVVVSCLAPGVVLLQTLIEPFYVIWTQGKIPFDPALFAMLSVGVLVYAVVQPAIAVVLGNNLLRPQVLINAAAAAIMVAGLFILVPVIGILGAGVALLAAELVASVAYVRNAKKWLRQHSLRWPKRAFMAATTSVCISAASLIVMVWSPELKWITLSVSAVLFFLNLWRFLRVLPTFASQRARHLIVKIPGLKNLATRYL